MRKTVLVADRRFVGDVYGAGMANADGTIPDAAFYGPGDAQYRELLAVRSEYGTEKMPAVLFDYALEQWNTHHSECKCIECRDTELLR